MTTICSACGSELQIGDYPFCPHGSTHFRDALNFDPVLVFEMPDGSHYYPGSNKDAAPVPGAKPILLDTLRKADRFMHSVNAREQEQMDRRTEAERNHYDRAKRESRESLRSELDKRGINRGNIEAIMADRDGKGPDKREVMRQFEAIAEATGQPFNREQAEQHYERTQRSRGERGRPQVNFDIPVFSFDASNRNNIPYCDARTGWKNRRG